MSEQKRKIPARQPVHRGGNRSPIIFLTVVSRDRKKIFGAGTHQLLLEAWKAADTWKIGRYVMMPDHIHLFCAPNNEDTAAITSWVRFWKTHVTRKWPNQKQKPIWQLSFWDRQLRSGESYNQKWDYVKKNPVRHGLVSKPEDWPYQGELNALEWHDEV